MHISHDVWTTAQVGNFALWINNATEYAVNLELMRKYVAKHKKQLPFMLWREASAQHFTTPTGDFAGAKKPYTCQPIGGKDNALQLLPSGALLSSRKDLQVSITTLKSGSSLSLDWKQPLLWQKSP